MKKVLLLATAALFFTVSKLNAQAPPCPTVNAGPDVTICAPLCTTLTMSMIPATINATTSYTISTPAYAPDPWNVGTTIAMWDDQMLGPYPIGFCFNFYGNPYTQFYIGSNGWLGFSAGQTATWGIGAPVPNNTGSAPRNCIMGPWQDINPGVG